ncbi:MAG: PIG-L deacetylase family protein [Promethearchaeota archaeon]
MSEGINKNQTKSLIKIENGVIPIIVPESIMVFAAHPDDELLSAGGTILKYRSFGTKITVVVATGGYGGYAKAEYKDQIKKKRTQEFEETVKALKCDFIELNYDEIQVNRESISRITNIIRDIRPQVIIMPALNDTHRAHRHLAEIVKEAIYHTATGKAYGGYGREFMPYAVYMAESPSCKFQYVDADVFITVDISEFWNEKINIFNKIYASQIEVLDRITIWAERTAKLRGNENHCDYGEAFIPLTEYVPLKILLQ